jgi:hypothetical protein
VEQVADQEADPDRSLADHQHPGPLLHQSPTSVTAE